MNWEVFMEKKKKQEKVASSSESEDLFNLGLEYWQQGKIKDCIRIFETLLTSFPKDPLRLVTCINLASCYLDTKNYQKSYQILTSIIEASKVEKFDSVLLSKAHQNLAILYEKRLFSALAVKEYNIALSINPNENFSKERLKHLSSNKFFNEDRILVVDIDLNGELSLIFGCNHLSTLKEFIMQNIDDIWSKLATSIAAVGNSKYHGNWKIVIQTFLEYNVVEIPFEHLKTLDADWLKELFTNIFSNPNNFQDCGIQAELLNNFGFPKKTLDEMEACNLGKNQFDDTISSQGHLDNDIEDYRQAIRNNPNDSEAHFILGVAFASKGQWDDAIEKYRQAIRINSEHSKAHFFLGVACAAIGHLGEAIEEYRQAIRINPCYCEAHHGLGVAFASKDQWDDAIEEFRQAIRINFEHSLSHHDLGVAFVSKGQLDDAIEEFRQAIRINPDYSDTHHNLGVAFISKGQLDNAIEEFKQAIRINSEHSQAHFFLGVSFAAIGQFDDAIEEYRQAIRINPCYCEAHHGLGSAFASKGQLDDAIKEFRQAIRINFEHSLSHHDLGFAFASKGQLDDAIEEYRQAIRINPHYSEAHHDLGVAFASKGQFDDAIEEYRQATIINPKYVKAYYNMGISLYAIKQLDEAMKAYRQAITINPEYAEAYINLGTIFYVKGQFYNAIKEYRQGLAIKPDQIEAHFNMGNALAEIGQLNEAIDAYKNFIKYAQPQYAQRVEQVKQVIRDLQKKHMNENQQFYYDNVNASNISECSEDYNLWRACISGDSEKVESLLQEGANPDARNEKGETPLILKYCAKIDSFTRNL